MGKETRSPAGYDRLTEGVYRLTEGVFGTADQLAKYIEEHAEVQPILYIISGAAKALITHRVVTYTRRKEHPLRAAIMLAAIGGLNGYHEYNLKRRTQRNS